MRTVQMVVCLFICSFRLDHSGRSHRRAPTFLFFLPSPSAAEFLPIAVGATVPSAAKTTIFSSSLPLLSPCVCDGLWITYLHLYSLLAREESEIAFWPSASPTRRRLLSFSPEGNPRHLMSGIARSARGQNCFDQLNSALAHVVAFISEVMRISMWLFVVLISVIYPDRCKLSEGAKSQYT